MKPDAKQMEELRHAALESLAIRPGCAFTASQVQKRVIREGALDMEPSEADTIAALGFLELAGHVKKDLDELGSTIYWQATASGILLVERSK